ncbi:MAG: hypothetical protein AB1758_32630, partial [Candidatus Eremiobacterota bacterium]
MRRAAWALLLLAPALGWLLSRESPPQRPTTVFLPAEWCSLQSPPFHLQPLPPEVASVALQRTHSVAGVYTDL